MFMVVEAVCRRKSYYAFYHDCLPVYCPIWFYLPSNKEETATAPLKELAASSISAFTSSVSTGGKKEREIFPVTPRYTLYRITVIQENIIKD